MSDTTYAIQILSKHNNCRSSLIHGKCSFLAGLLQGTLDSDLSEVSEDDYVIIILETDEHGNEISKFSTKPILTIPHFIEVIIKESKND